MERRRTRLSGSGYLKRIRDLGLLLSFIVSVSLLSTIRGQEDPTTSLNNTGNYHPYYPRIRNIDFDSSRIQIQQKQPNWYGNNKQKQSQQKQQEEQGAIIDESGESLLSSSESVVSTVTSSSSSISSSNVKKVTSQNDGSSKWKEIKDKDKNGKIKKLSVLYDSSGIDREFQLELLTAVQIALKNLNENEEKQPLFPDYIDVGKIPSSPSTTTSLMTVAQWFRNNRTSTAVSLLDPEILSEFVQIYDQQQDPLRYRSTNPSITMPSLKKINNLNLNLRRNKKTSLKLVSPRLLRKNVLGKNSVEILSLQMSEMALCTALLNRVEKIGVRRLIPILDQDDSAQLELLGYFIATGEHRIEPIHFTPPIFVTFGEKSHALRDVLNDVRNAESQHGILMLATRASQSVMEVANESHNYLQMRWFSPNLLEYEEWALRGPGNANLKTKATFGIYSVHYVGAQGWDNPSRRQTLRELNYNTDASPRILSSILAYDATWVARNSLRNNKLTQPLTGLSGEITFDKEGYRREGLYFGVSAVPELVSPLVTLLQPSTWILEDVLNVIETIEGQYLITDYSVATSSMLTNEELSRFASQTANSSDCEEHVMEIMTHDPFNQMPTKYLFKRENLPHHLLIPNQHGYGITFMCGHKDTSRTTLKIACSPGGRFSDPVICFRSHVQLREKRQTVNSNSNPSFVTGYQTYGNLHEYSPSHSYSLGGQSLPNNNLNSLYAQYKSSGNRRDDASKGGSGYYGPPSQYGVPSATYGPLTSRFDAPIQSDDASSTTPMSAPPPPGGKLPELRQVLKAAKPFVGSCVGAATGCAMCVLVLGRLPLGTAPPACTGPCFVGVFGSCGALLGRAFSETTVICTELFRQGLLDQETYFADAEFGRNIYKQSPMTMEGYHILALPVVQRMRKSKDFTNLVAKFAIPWARYMMYDLGYGDEFNWLGFSVNFIGTPICLVVGYANKYVFTPRVIWTYNKLFGSNFDPVVISLTVLLMTLLAFLLLHKRFNSKKKNNVK